MMHRCNHLRSTTGTPSRKFRDVFRRRQHHHVRLGLVADQPPTQGGDSMPQHLHILADAHNGDIPAPQHALAPRYQLPHERVLALLRRRTRFRQLDQEVLRKAEAIVEGPPRRIRSYRPSEELRAAYEAIEMRHNNQVVAIAVRPHILIIVHNEYVSCRAAGAVHALVHLLVDLAGYDVLETHARLPLQQRRARMHVVFALQ
mmetsp:Transcript_38736/g.86142  ORF Transcript_38736/g.86142 Transcript_38736/m.86142 type:complete len:202 (+) Transcript_38736:139-744(+)